MAQYFKIKSKEQKEKDQINKVKRIKRKQSQINKEEKK